jgi:hypothetical protein
MDAARAERKAKDEKWRINPLWLALLVTAACFLTLAVTRLILLIARRRDSASLSPTGRSPG